MDIHGARISPLDALSRLGRGKGQRRPRLGRDALLTSRHDVATVATALIANLGKQGRATLVKASASHARNKDSLCAEDKTKSQLMGGRCGSTRIHAGNDAPQRHAAGHSPAAPKRVRPPTADVAVGVGHPLMCEDRIARGLARIAAKGIRTATVREIGGVPVVMTTELPEGVTAMMAVDRITAYRAGETVAWLPIPLPPRM